jgi:hypothetical protein
MSMIHSVIKSYQKDFCTSMNSDYRRRTGGQQHNSHWPHAQFPKLSRRLIYRQSCTALTIESRVLRYYACESLYNIAKSVA